MDDAFTNYVDLFEGRVGGGKTYHATLRIITHLARGGIVATNIQLHPEAINEYIPRRFSVIPQLDKQLYVLDEEQLKHFEQHIPIGTGKGSNPLIVLDEFHLWFNSRDYKKTDEQARTSTQFFSQCRKCHVDLVLIAQSIGKIDKQFREPHRIYRFRDLQKWKIPGLGFRLPFCKKYFLAVVFDADGTTLIEKIWTQKDSDIFKCYQSDSFLRPIKDLSTLKVENLDLEKVQKPKTDFIPWLFYALFAALIYLKL